MNRGKGDPNRLIHETSPYLLQHAHNPVDWYPWGPEALERARSEDKPIFLSIGYSACHWCHVMAHESFENEDLAAYLNEHFIPIKVDREERPDLDRVYQEAARLTGAQGGWPLSVFLTPDQQPFWIGTYFPPEDRQGRPGFSRVIRTMVRTFNERREHVDEVAGNITSKLEEASRPQPATKPDRGLLQHAAVSLEQFFDRANGGFGNRPKFPNPTALEVLLRAAYRNEEHHPGAQRHYLDLFLSALNHMASGGVYDQLGGGFHRYSVDASWSVPHFEKMLYDNAQLVPLYLAAFQLTGHGRYRRVVTSTLDYVLREMTDATGGFYSTQDADTEGREGRFFTWKPVELKQVLGAELGELAASHFGVTDEGNLEDGQTVLSIATTVEDLASDLALEPGEVETAVETARRELFEARQARPRPSTDDKLLVSWNGLMIDAFARAGLALGEAPYVAAARRAADFIIKTLYDPQDHTLRHVYRDGSLNIRGYLDDYSFLARGLLSIYSATWNVEYLEAALNLSETALREFWSDEKGGFFYTPAKGEQLVHRPRDPYDAAVPAAGSVAVHNMVLLESFSEGDTFGEYIERTFDLYGGELEANPFGLASLVLAHDSYLHGPVEVTVVAPRGRKSVLDSPLHLPPEWLVLLRRTFVPDLLFTTPAAQYRNRPIWDGKVDKDNRLTWYVCQNLSCSPPAFSVDEVSNYLNVRRRGGT